MLKVIRQQQGLAPIQIILIVAGILGIGVASYFVLIRDSDTSTTVTNLSAEQRAVEAGCKKEIDDKDFCAFASSVNFEQPYTATITSTTSEGTSVIVLESAGENSRITSSVDGTEVSSIITIGEASYIKNLTANNWIKYSGVATQESDAPNDEIASNFAEEIAKDTISYKNEGKEACGTLTCFKYTVTDTSEGGETWTVWFDDEDYILRRMSFSDEESSSDIVYTYSEVTITEPSPVIDAPTTDGLTGDDLQQTLQDALTEFGN